MRKYQEVLLGMLGETRDLSLFNQLNSILAKSKNKKEDSLLVAYSGALAKTGGAKAIPSLSKILTQIKKSYNKLVVKTYISNLKAGKDASSFGCGAVLCIPN